MIFTSRDIRSPKLQATSTLALLSVTSSFSWTDYISVTVKKALRMVAILRHLRSAHRFSSKHLLRVYQIYIRPLLEYSSATWSALRDTSAHDHHLQSVQNKALAIANIDLNTLPLSKNVVLQLSLPFSIESSPTLFLPISLNFALGHLFKLYLTETFVTLLLFVSPVLNLHCSCPPLCIPLALLLTIRVRPGLIYSLRFTLLISLIAFVCLFIYLFIYLLI